MKVTKEELKKVFSNKIIIILLIALIISIATVIVVISYNNPVRILTTHSKVDISDRIKNQTTNNQGDFELSKLSINSVGSKVVVSGKIKAISKKDEVKLEVLYYGDGDLKGVASITINDVNKYAKKFEISMVLDYELLDTYEIIVP